MALLMEEFSNIKQAFKSQIYTTFESIAYSTQSHNMTTHNNALFLIFILLIVSATSFRFSLTQSEPSLWLTFDVKGKQTFSAVSSGEQNHDITILIDYKSNQRNDVQSLLNKTTNDVDFTNVYEEGIINVTMISSTGTDRNVSFDFYSQDDPLVKMIDKKDIKYVEEVLVGVFKGLTDISRNQQFHIERDQSHKNTLQQSQSSIKWTGIIKILFLLSSALIQLWIMKGFFTNTHHSYQPVEMQ